MMSQHEWVASTQIGGKEEVAPGHQAANIKAAASPLSVGFEHQTLEQIDLQRDTVWQRVW